MSGSLGALDIELTLGTASFTSGLEKSAYQMSHMAGQMVSSLSSVDAMLHTVTRSIETVAELVGVGIGLHAFKELVAGSIEAADKLGDLARYTGATVEDLSKLQQPANLAGVSMDEVAGMVAKLSANLAAAQDPTSKAAGAFNAFGITTADVNRLLHENSVQALIEVAQKLDEFKGGVNKAAGEAAIFGKGSAQTAIFVQNLAENLGLTVTVTTAQSEAAHEAKVAHEELKTAFAVLTNQAVAGLTPALTDINKAFAGLVTNKQATVEVFETLGTALKLAAGTAGLLWTALADTGEAIGLIAALGEISKAAGGGAAGFAAQKQAFADFMDHVDGRKTQLVDFWTNLNLEGHAHTEAAKAAGDHDKAVGDLSKTQKAAIPPGVAWVNTILDQIAALEDGATATAYLKAAQAGLSAEQAGPYISALQEAKAVHDDLTARINAGAAAEKTYFDALGATINQQSAARVKLLDSIAAITDETATLGMSDAQRKIYNTGLELEAAKQRDAADSTIDTRQAVSDLTDKMNALYTFAARSDMLDAAKAAQQAWQDTANTIGSALERAFFDGIKKGKGLFDDLKTALESMFAKLVLRPILEPIAGAAASLVTGSANASGGGALSLFGDGGNLLSGLGDSLFGGGGGAAFGAGFGSPLSTLSALLSGGGDFASPMMALASGLGALTPIVGIAAAIIPLISSLFSGGGGPKQGGAANSGIAGFNMYPGETSESANSTLAKVIAASGASYQGFIKALGGSGAANFGLSYDTDPNGKASNRISAGATVNGQSVYNVLDKDIGRDAATLQADLALYSQRALLAALQASNFPSDIAHIFNAISVSTASADSIGRILAYASAVGTVNVALANIGDIGAAVDKLAKATPASTFAAQGAALQGLMDNFDGSVTQTNALSAATQSYYTSLVNLIAQIKQVQQAVDSMFAASSQSIFLSGRDNAFLTSYYQKQQASALAALPSLTDPNSIQNAGKQINDAIMAIWNGMSSGDQATNRQWFLDMLSQGQAAVDAQLTKIGTDAQTKAQAQLDALHGLLMSAADKMSVAADTQVSAANTQASAAGTPTTVDVNFTANVPGTAQVNVSGAGA